MRERLAGTLDYVFEEVGEALGGDRGEAGRVISEIRAGPQPPNRFGA